MNEVIKSNGPSFSREEKDEIKVMPGSWWLLKDEWLKKGHGEKSINIPAGTYILCSKANFVDGVAHSVVLNCPPMFIDESDLKYENNTSWTVLVANLLLHAEQRPEAEAMASRQLEIENLNNLIEEDKNSISLIQSKLSNISMSIGNSATNMIADESPKTDNISKNEIVNKKQENIKDITNTISSSSSDIAKLAEQMSNKTLKISAYYTERARAAKAAVQPVQMIASRLGEYVDTLGLYIGNGITATKVVDGAGAPSDAKLLMFQRIIYLDEELLVHIMDGGATHEDTNKFFNRLANDKSFADRIFGGPRSVILMRPRRHDRIVDVTNKQYTLHEAIKEILQLSDAAERDRTLFMAIRDGERFWYVSLPPALQKTNRFFPTPDDLEAPYRERSWYNDKPARKIGQDDTKYAAAVEEFRVMALNYERILLVLWGLHDRIGIFGDFAQGDSRNFANPEFQNDYLHFVMDDQDLLGENRPDWRSYISEQNKNLTKSSRVVCFWKRLVNYEVAPKWVTVDNKTYNERYAIFFPDPISVQTAFENKGLLSVKAPVAREYYDKNGFNVVKYFNIVVPLEQSRFASKKSEPGYLVLDNLDYRDLEYYINNRTSREDYLEYIGFMFIARDILRSEYMEDLPSINALSAMAGLDDETARRACRKWRAINKGAAAPKPGDDAFIDLEHIARSDNPSEIDLKDFFGKMSDDIEQDLQIDLDQPIALTKTAEGLFYCIYRSYEKESIKSFLGVWPYVNKAKIESGKNGFTLTEHKELGASSVLKPGEQIIRKYSEIPDDKVDMSPANVLRNLDNAMLLLRKPSPILNPIQDPEKLKSFSNLVYKGMLSDGRVVNYQLFAIPVGFATTRQNGIISFNVVMLCADALMLMLKTENGYKEVVDLIKNTHANPHNRIQAYENDRKVKYQIFLMNLNKFNNKFAQSGESLNGFLLGKRTDLKGYNLELVSYIKDKEFNALGDKGYHPTQFFSPKNDIIHSWIDVDFINDIGENWGIEPFQDPDCLEHPAA